MQLGMGFWASKAMLSAVELGVFTAPRSWPDRPARPAGQTETASPLGPRLPRHPGGPEAARTRGRPLPQCPDTDLFLDKAKPSYIGGILEMANAWLCGFCGSLTEALLTGEPQNEAKHSEDFFAAIYAEPARLHGFLEATSGISAGAAQAIAARFDWSKYTTFTDGARHRAWSRW